MGNLLYKFYALGYYVRLRIINLLFQGTLCVCDLQKILKMSQPRISRHLTILKKAKLVNCKLKAKWCHYDLIQNTENTELFNFIKENYKKEKIYGQDTKFFSLCFKNDNITARKKGNKCCS